MHRKREVGQQSLFINYGFFFCIWFGDRQLSFHTPAMDKEGLSSPDQCHTLAMDIDKPY